MGIKTEQRNQKRKEVVEAIIIRQEPCIWSHGSMTFSNAQYLTGCHFNAPVVGMRLKKANAAVVRANCQLKTCGACITQSPWAIRRIISLSSAYGH